MKIAILADIHSNIHGLQAAIKDIQERQVDLTVCTGDLVGYGTFPNEVIDLIRRHNILTVRGNYDDAVGNELMACGCDYPDPRDAENASASLNWSIDNTSETNKNYLRSLPTKVTLSFEGKTITFVHGSPRKINEYLKENSKEADEVMADFRGNILVCGHTHKPYFKMYGDKMLINAGSAGKPKAGNPRANYVILNLSNDGDFVEIIEVAYDHEKAAQAIEDSGLPKAFAELIRTGKA